VAKDKKLIEPTDAEDAWITTNALDDPDGHPVTDEMFKHARRGRPAGMTKTPVSIRLDNAVLDALKGDNPKGWQTRANELLKKGLGL
jgi:uncharacterized protein (DUF4415 family)